MDLDAEVRREARHFLRLASQAAFWTQPTYKRFLQGYSEVLAGIVGGWARRVLSREARLWGAKLDYKVISHDDSNVHAGFFLRYPRGMPRILYLGLYNIADYEVDGEKFALPHTMLAFYGLANIKYYRLIDFILPRFKRKFPARGYMLEIVRYSPQIVDEEYAYQWDYVGTEQLVTYGKKKRLETRFGVSTRCFSAWVFFTQYKARYLLFIPPAFIVWKWGHVIVPTGLKDKKRDPTSCGVEQA